MEKTSNNTTETKKKVYGRIFCDYKIILEKLLKGGVTDLELFQLQGSLVRPGGFVDNDAARAFGQTIKAGIRDTNSLPVSKPTTKKDEKKPS